MALYIIGKSALEYWRRTSPSHRQRTRAALPFGSDKKDGCFARADLAAIQEAGLDWLSLPLHILVPHSSWRRACKEASFHTCSYPLPEGSFMRASQHVMVSSPELTCIDIATSSQFPLLVEILYELCGNYRLPAGRTEAAISMPPATSIASLSSFTNRVPGIRGARTLRRALRYTCDHSRSPMETATAETLVLDPRMGGFGLAKPQLNPRFIVVGKQRKALPQSSYLPDLYWGQADISIEYESDKHHEGSAKLSKDAIRRNGIEHLGTRVLSLTWNQARNFYEFERVALMAAKVLGKRFSADWDRWAQKRIELHRLLIQGRHDSRPS